MLPQPLIAVRDVQASSEWYQTVLGCESGHGGPEYEQLMFKGKLVMQLHHWDAHKHPHLGKQDSKPYGNGVLLWFETSEFDAVIERAKTMKTKTLDGPKVNETANHRELWLQDPNGYVVVLASAYGDLGSP